MGSGGHRQSPTERKRAGEQVALAFPRSPRALECTKALISTTPQPREQKFSIWMHEKFKSLCQREALPKKSPPSHIPRQSGDFGLMSTTRRVTQSLSEAERRMNVSTQQSSRSDARDDALTAVLPSQRLRLSRLPLHGIMTAICAWLLNAN